MALSTKAQADQNALLTWLQSAEGEADQRPPRGAQRTFQFRFTLATTEIDNADDRVRLLWFPAGIFLLNAQVWVEDDLDTNVSPALVWDLITETAAGVADTRKVISAATAGQSAGEGADMDAGGAIHVGERYLVFDPTTAAATAAAGDILLTVTVARGIATDALPSLTMDAV